MSWRLAKSLETLRAQINAAYPKRSKASDGTIGDAAHASRSSDHNPWVKDGATGVVTALDITHDPANGLDIQKLADTLLASKDSRIKYIICNGRIASGSGQKHPAWQWRNYTGSNKHTKHVHISVKSSKAEYDATGKWAISGTWVEPPKPVPVAPTGPAPTTYTVFSGDTWSGIAKRFGLNLNQLLAWNDADPKEVLRIGRVIRLAAAPAPAAPVPAPKPAEPVQPAPAPPQGGFWASLVAAITRLFQKG